MPGFLSEFAGTILVDAENGKVVDAKTTWWVELLRNLPHADHVEADKILAEAMAINTSAAGVPESVRMGGEGLILQQEEVLVRSLVAWNLTDDNGEVLPFGTVEERRASLGRLPEQVVLALKNLAVTNNQPRKGTEAATFPGAAPDVGDNDRDGRDSRERTVEPVEVPA